MEDALANKLIRIKDVLEIANLIYSHNRTMVEEFQEEKRLYGEEDPNKIYKIHIIYSDLTFGIIKKGGNQENRQDFEWFKNALLSQAANIEGISIRYSCSFNKNKKYCEFLSDRNESFDLYLTENYCTLSKQFSENNDEYRKVSSQIENIINKCPNRFDKTLKNRAIRRFLPSFAISSTLSLILGVVIYFLTRFEIITGSFVEYTSNNYILVGGAAGLCLLLGIVLPNSNMSLYKRLVVDKKYERYNYDWEIDHYENDFDKYKSKVEFAVGKYYQSDKIREKIEKNFKISILFFCISLTLLAAFCITIFFI